MPRRPVRDDAAFVSSPDSHLERLVVGPVVFLRTAVVAHSISSERQMSKHRAGGKTSKRGRTSKRARSPKIASRAQRNKQAVVRSREGKVSRPAGVDVSRKFLEDSKQGVAAVENQMRALQDDVSQKKGISLSFNMQAYQAKLLEIAQANIQFTLEFGQRLAMIRSPIELLVVIAEFTNRRIDMIAKHSMAINPLWGAGVSQALMAPPRR